MKSSTLVLFVTCLVGAALAQGGGGGYKQPEGFFQYVNVPGHKEYEFGFNRGHPFHYVSRFEQAKDHRFRTRVKWFDKKEGYGEHYWEYNHGPPKYEEPKPTYHEPAPYHPPPKGYPSENIPVFVSYGDESDVAGLPRDPQNTYASQHTPEDYEDGTQLTRLTIDPQSAYPSQRISEDAAYDDGSQIARLTLDAQKAS